MSGHPGQKGGAQKGMTNSRRGVEDKSFLQVMNQFSYILQCNDNAAFDALICIPSLARTESTNT